VKSEREGARNGAMTQSMALGVSIRNLTLMI